ncbi:hypothetical protein P3T36_007549 [Kitasatospora sp. MAP12-15]|uniref:(2Fe-2S)-binding protein n=1 Tax=unclassified Kitasatospora TaxID=2633591 RepID=UPI002475718F|nr:(2Fe-2S)-binding protein [Kitasatospora sp. MAP12-44]MDH6108949.1 hypothetical protein [Kitasatospora sp. MAP12-44]
MLDAQAIPARSGEPLVGGYRRLADVCEALRFSVLEAGQPAPSADQGWCSVAELAQCRDRLVEAEARRISARYGCAVPGHVAASRLLHHYLWSACLLISGPWYLDRRVPRLRPADIWIEAATGDLAVRPGRLTRMAGDRVGELRWSGDGEVSSEEELRAELRAAVVAHAAPVLEAFRPAVKRGDRALWGMVTDDLVSGIWYLGRMLGEEERAVAAACAVLPGATPPLPGAAAFRRLPADAPAADPGPLTRTRLGCCLYYTIRPADTCLTCPRLTDTERLRRLAV